MKSSSPRTALTGVPSGAGTVSGTPKKARKYSDGVSSSISRSGCRSHAREPARSHPSAACTAYGLDCVRMTAPASPPPDRLSHARKAGADAGIDALLVTPGPDLRWLTGYEALPLERLTCLVLPADGRAVHGRARGWRCPAVRGRRRAATSASRSWAGARPTTRTP